MYVEREACAIADRMGYGLEVSGGLGSGILAASSR
jgi:hypothetical protein